MRAPVPALVGLLLLSIGARATERETPPKYAGRPLLDVLGELRARGLKLIYSSDLVGPTMRVEAEPRGGESRQVLEEVLAPHGLAARRGPGGSLLVVIRRRGPKEGRPSKAKTPQEQAAISPGVARFEETVEVTAPSGSPSAGSTPLSVGPQVVASAAGSGENVFRALQALPGISAPDDLDSRLAVRGGGPDENLTVMDGVEIHDPYRLLGFTSAFNPSLVQNFDLFAGGFDVRYGDRLSSLLVIENRSGQGKRAFGGEAGLNLTDASLVLEGRLPGTTSGSWIFAGRRAYYDLVAERLLDVGDLPSFSDLQAKVSWEPRAGQRLSLFGLLSDESADIATRTDDEDFVIRTLGRNFLGGLRFDSTLGAGGRSATVASFYRFEDGIDFQGRIESDARRAAGSVLDSRLADVVFIRDIDVSDIALRQEVTLVSSGRQAWDFGLEAHRLRTQWGWRVDGDSSEVLTPRSNLPLDSGLPPAFLPRSLDSNATSWRTGLWVQDRFTIGSRLSLRAGARVDRSSVNRETTLSPRIGATWTLTPATRVNAAAGLYYQSPGYEKLFQSDYFVDLTPEGGLALATEKSFHTLVGLERDLAGSLSARVTAYHKSYSSLIVGRLETEEERQARVARYDFPPSLSDQIPSEPQITSNPVSDGRGNAWGVEVYLARRTVSPATRLSGWVSYAFGRARREAYGRQYAFDYDRRHALSLAGEYRIGPRLSFSLTGRVASGFPLTPAVGVRVAAIEDGSDVDGDGDREERIPARDSSGALIYAPDFGPVANLNSARLPLFARFDARLTFRPGGARGKWLLYVDVINLLNRHNAGRISYIVQRRLGSDQPGLIESRIASIPLLPSFGVHFRF